MGCCSSANADKPLRRASHGADRGRGQEGLSSEPPAKAASSACGEAVPHGQPAVKEAPSATDRDKDEEVMTTEQVVDWLSTLACLSELQISELKNAVRDRQMDGTAFALLASEGAGFRLAELGVVLSRKDELYVREVWSQETTACRAVAEPPAPDPVRRLSDDFHGAYTGGIAQLVRIETRDLVQTRLLCCDGERCCDRSSLHREARSHPFDRDYQRACAVEGREPEESLSGLFAQVTSGHANMSFHELKASEPLLSRVFGRPCEITCDLCKQLDKDGNGAINYSEFAKWAQKSNPRLKTGLAHLFPQTKTKEEAPGTPPGEEEIPYPDHWKCDGIFDFNNPEPTRADSSQRGTDLSRRSFQRLLDETYSPKCTRDRRRHNPGELGDKVPTKYRIVDVVRNENSKEYRAYAVKRARLSERYKSEKITLHEDVRTSIALASLGKGTEAARLDASCNEWYLFHGTNLHRAQQICNNGFKMRFAGSATGTLYGRGTYLCESITKADEYAEPSDEGLYAVLLCRAIGGRVLYTADRTADSRSLEERCLQGQCDSVLGDRLKCNGTYREFVFYDSENIYPEYMILYKREY